MKLTELDMKWVREDLDAARRLNASGPGLFESVIEQRLKQVYDRLFPVVEVEVEAEVPDDGVYRG